MTRWPPRDPVERALVDLIDASPRGDWLTADQRLRDARRIIDDLRQRGFEIIHSTSSDTPDTGAGTPLMAAPESAHSGDYNLGWSDGQATALDACNPIIEALQAQLVARPATDPAGLDVERLARAMKPVKRRTSFSHPLDPPNYERGFQEEYGAPTPGEVAAEYARLSVADGPGPEERA